MTAERWRAAVTAVLDALPDVTPRCGDVTVLAVDGGAAAGKSELATELAAALQARVLDTVHTDDLLEGWTGQFTFWPRLRDDVLQPLSRGRPGHYRRYDWNIGAFADEVTVVPPQVLLVEGVSAIQACGPYLALGVLITVDRAERERRWRARDLPSRAEVDPQHEPQLPAEWRTWLAAEDDYFGAWQAPVGVPILRC
ncbi:MAG: uridine kinase [Frankiales bacterium]|nr:uridine kinase [Frankiales bacterium]